MQRLFEFEDDLLSREINAWEHSDADKGQIYTRPEVVEFMLTAIGLNSIADFDKARILEPSCGEGEFVVAILVRMLGSYVKAPPAEFVAEKVLAVDLVGSSLEVAKGKISNILFDTGYSAKDVQLILEKWFRLGDYLLDDFGRDYTHIIGNPPYVRVENIPKKLLSEYRKRYFTMTDRADIYIPFYQKSLSLLGPKGRLSFICTDRWTKNTYGSSLRGFISEGFSLDLFVDLYGVNAFETEVMTYPAITQISKNKQSRTILAHGSEFTHKEALEALSAVEGKDTSLTVRNDFVFDNRPWLLESQDRLGLIRKIEGQFSPLEEVGCRVYIGAATGANKIYVLEKEVLGEEFESDRLLPVITASEIKKGKIDWKGRYLINTYDEFGVIDLKRYPKLAAYLEKNKEALSKRHVAKKDKQNWFKTIDRVYADRAQKPKLLIPDISIEPVVVYDRGGFHPNNSIYYICSSTWNLNALKVILLSSITRFFMTAYSTKISNGYLRFQAQHLRKLRLPKWETLDVALRERLVSAGENDSSGSYDELAARVYCLTEQDKELIGVRT